MKDRTLFAALPLTMGLLLPLLGCGILGPFGDDSSVVTGFVLEYTDSTHTTTVPAVNIGVDLLLPEGETRRECSEPGFSLFGGSRERKCFRVEWLIGASTFPGGRYSFRIEDPEHCALRVRAYEGSSGLTHTPYGKTATAPRLAALCEDNGVYEGATLILKYGF